MFVVSKDSPCFYLTSVTRHRLPVFRTDKICEVVCTAIDEARKSCGFLLLAYAVMPDHLHVVTDSAKKSGVILRFINGIISRRVIDYLKDNNYESSLAKLRHQEQARSYKYSLWEHHPNVMLLWNEVMLMQRVHYTHQNPVRAGLVEDAREYRWSSWRCWNGRASPDELLPADIGQIRWRQER